MFQTFFINESLSILRSLLHLLVTHREYVKRLWNLLICNILFQCFQIILFISKPFYLLKLIFLLLNTLQISK